MKIRVLLALTATISSVSLVQAGCAEVAQHDDAKGHCDITSLFLRGESGFPIQVEKGSDGAYSATMCEDVPAFRVTVKQNEPVFSTGITCSISGVPAGTTQVDHGATKVVDISVVEKPSPKDKDGKEVTTKYKVSVKRLGLTADQDACKITMKRSAIQDCGYAPTLEKKRQEAAMNKGMKPPPTPAPTDAFLQQIKVVDVPKIAPTPPQTEVTQPVKR
jgi:hypothetical protein